MRPYMIGDIAFYNLQGHPLGGESDRNEDRVKGPIAPLLWDRFFLFRRKASFSSIKCVSLFCASASPGVIQSKIAYCAVGFQ